MNSVPKKRPRLKLNACKRCGGALVDNISHGDLWWACLNCGRSEDEARVATPEVIESLNKKFVEETLRLFRGL